MKLTKTVEAAYSNNAVLAKTEKAVHRRRRSDQLALEIVPYESRNIVAGPFTINDRNKTVYVEGKRCNLSPKEFELLKYLAEDPGRVVSSEEIIAKLWPRNNAAGASDVKQYVHLLRRRIERNPNNPRWIENVRGFGYRLAVTED